VNRSKRLSVAAAAAGVVGTMLIAGCAGGSAAQSAASLASPAPTNAPVPAPVPVVSDVLRQSLPIASYQLTPAQLGEEQYLTQRLTQACMSGYGIDYLPTLSEQLVTQNVDIAEEFDSRWYGVSDSSAVQSYGYHLPTWTQGMTAPAKLPAVGGDVLTGAVTSYDHKTVPAGGCLSEVSKELSQAGLDTQTQESGGSGPGTLIGDIQSSAFQSAQSDPRVTAVFGTWSACMSSHGYHYSTPFTAAADPRWSAAAKAGPVELATAEQDLRCKQQVNLLGVEFTVVSAYQNAGLTHDAHSLAGVRTELATQAAAISRLMARWAPAANQPS